MTVETFVSLRATCMAAAASVALAAAALVAAPGEALAQKGDSTPKPAIDCNLKKNQKKAACQNKHKLDDEELFRAGYWLARDGHYAEAIDFLSHARSDSDPRILTYLGFANRKLGNVDVAMGFYARALAADPNYTIARAYLGEALLLQGERAKAEGELAEIAARCGPGCEEYKELADAIARHDAPKG
jgi:tetratricopeptide (TPR) repeat protein